MSLFQIGAYPSRRTDQLVLNPTEPRSVWNRAKKRIDDVTHEIECSLIDAVQAGISMLHDIGQSDGHASRNRHAAPDVPQEVRKS